MTSHFPKPFPRLFVLSTSTSTLPSSEVERTFDTTSNRPDLLMVSTTLYSPSDAAAPPVDYNFSGTRGLLETVATDGRTITYGYDNAGTQPTALTYAIGSSTLLSTLRPTPNGLVSGVTHSEGGTIFESLSYGYSVDRVTSVYRGHEGGASNEYQYDARGQVTGGSKRLQDEIGLVPGYQTGYTYDMAGNRTTKTRGSGLTPEDGQTTTTYGSANALNQYPTVAHGNNNVIEVAGQRNAITTKIRANGQEASYTPDFDYPYLSFRKELAVTPATNQRYVDVAITAEDTAVTPSVTTTLDSGKIYVPPATELLTYDADGNLLSDGRWLYTWDAENRLASLVPAAIPSGPREEVRLYFTYDGLSRRVCTRSETKFYAQTGPSVSHVFTMNSRTAFTYDGWNMVRSVRTGGTNGSFTSDASSSTTTNYVWGPDIGSPTHGHTSWQKAGGVGGLLFVNSNSGTYGKQFPLMDRLGNVTGYRRAVTNSPAALDAVYEYDPFGREVRSTGPASDLMPFRFSTKYTETESGLVYYGYRFYDPDRGRWVNRDPIGEKGGLNLFSFEGNDLLNYVDVNGLAKFPWGVFLPTASAGGSPVSWCKLTSSLPNNCGSTVCEYQCYFTPASSEIGRYTYYTKHVTEGQPCPEK